MALTKERAAYLKKRMEESEEWIRILEDGIRLARERDNPKDVGHLDFILGRERQLFTALKRALEANKDTFVTF